MAQEIVQPSQPAIETSNALSIEEKLEQLSARLGDEPLESTSKAVSPTGAALNGILDRLEGQILAAQQAAAHLSRLASSDAPQVVPSDGVAVQEWRELLDVAVRVAVQLLDWY